MKEREKAHNIYITGILLILLLLSSSSVMGSNTASQDISITVEAINEISLSSGTVDLVINTANAGITPGDNSFTVTDSTTTMSYTTNEASKKITAALDNNFTDITFKVNVTSTSATSAGDVILSVTSEDIITGLGNASDSGEIITYTATALPNTVPNTGETNTITFTLTDS